MLVRPVLLAHSLGLRRMLGRNSAEREVRVEMCKYIYNSNLRTLM